VKGKLSFAGCLIIAYWVFCAVVYLTIDLFIDLYTDYDYIHVFWWTALIILPLAAYSIYFTRKSLLSTWYTYLIFPMIIYGLYLGSAYFTALRLDLLISASIKPETEQVLPVKSVQQIFARKTGFINTDVTLRYQQQLITFEGTRTSYFFLKYRKAIRGSVGQSYLGNYYIPQIQIPGHERWAARWAYLKDWFKRYYWLLIALPLLFGFGSLKEKYFPAHPANTPPVKRPYYKFFRLLFIVIISLFVLFMLLLLLLGLFS